MVAVQQSRVLLSPADMNASLRFYDDQVGLVRYREWGSSPNRGVVYFLGGGFLELTESSTAPEGEGAPAGVRLWLQVGDVEAVRDELAGRGVEIAAEPERKPWGLLEMSVHDPDGLELIFVETPLDHPLRRRD